MENRQFTYQLFLAGSFLVLWSACSSGPGPSSLAGSTLDLADGTVSKGRTHGERSVLPERPDLQDFLRVAALNNPGLEAAFNRWKAALERLPQVRALPDPQFTYGYFVEQVETRVGPQRQRFGIAQTFPWFGTLRLRDSLAGEQAQAAQARYEATKLDLFYEVKEAFYEYAYLRQAIRLSKENIALLRHLESVAEARFRAGSDVTGLVKAQVELGKLEDRLQALEELRKPISGRLNAAMNRDLAELLPWPNLLPTSSEVVDEASFNERLEILNPELQALDASKREAALAVRLSKKAFYPDLTFGVDYVETGDAGIPGVGGSGKDPVMVMGRFNIPLWREKNRAGLREAKLKQEAAEKSWLDRRNGLKAELQMLVYRYRDAERKISLYGDTLTPLSENALDVAEQAYSAGRVDFLELIDSQRLLLDIQLSYQRALADRAQRLAQIERLVGGSLNFPESINR